MKIQTMPLFLAVLLLTFCGCGSSTLPTPGTGQPVAQGDGAAGTVMDFFSGAFEGWGQAAFLQAIGFTAPPATAQQLNEVLGDLSKLESQVQAVETQLQDLEGDFAELKNLVNERFTQEEMQYLDNLETDEDGNWNQYNNVVGEQTLAQVAASAETVSSLTALLDDPFLNALFDQAQQLSGESPSGVQYGTLVSDLLDGMLSVLEGKVPQQGVQGSKDFESDLDGYNEGLMNQYYYVVLSLQRVYLMESTSLYLYYNTSGKYTALLGETGIDYTKTYDENLDTLNSLFSDRFKNLKSLVSKAIVSDEDTESTIVAKKLPGVVGGTWTDKCQLYIWKGLYTDGYKFYGYWDGVKLTAKCQGEGEPAYYNYSNTITSECADAASDTLSFYYGEQPGGKGSHGELICSAPSAAWIADTYPIPAFDGSLGSLHVSATAVDCWPATHTGKFYINKMDIPFGVLATNTIHVANDGVWYDYPCEMPPSGQYGLIQADMPDGLIAFFTMQFNISNDGGIMNTNAQILCNGNDPWCQESTTSPGTALTFGNGHTVTFTLADSSHFQLNAQ